MAAIRQANTPKADDNNAVKRFACRHFVPYHAYQQLRIEVGANEKAVTFPSRQIHHTPYPLANSIVLRITHHTDNFANDSRFKAEFDALANRGI